MSIHRWTKALNNSGEMEKEGGKEINVINS
jgi:hypothetical protein